MWLEGPAQDEEWAAELEQSAAHWHVDEPPAPTAADSPSASAAATFPTPAPPPPIPDHEVEERLGAVAAEEGWDEDEVAAIRAYLTTPPATEAEAAAVAAPPDSRPHPTSELDLPGADELDDAMAALARPVAPPAEPTAVESATDWPETDALGPPDAPSEERLRAWVAPHERIGPSPDLRPEALSQTTSTPAEPEPEWLRGRQDAAARAYRRLRRIFPAER